MGILKVRARGTAMVPKFEAFPARRFVGRTPADMDGRTAWPATVEPDTVPDLAEYRAALRAGDLWPADKPTADKIGARFDPTYGGEFSPAPATKRTTSE